MTASATQMTKGQRAAMKFAAMKGDDFEKIRAQLKGKKAAPPVDDVQDDDDLDTLDQTVDDIPEPSENRDETSDGIDDVEEEAEDPKLAKIKAEYEALKGRLAPLQRNLASAELAVKEAQSQRAQMDAAAKAKLAEQEKEIKELRELVEAQQEKIDPLSLLSEDEKAVIDPDQLKVFLKLNQEMLKRQVGSLSKKLTDFEARVEEIAERRIAKEQKKQDDALRFDLMNDPAYDGLNKLLKTPLDDPDLNKWLSSEEGLNAGIWLQNLAMAQGSDNIKRTAKKLNKEIKAYPKFQDADGKVSPPEPDVQTRLAAHARRQKRDSDLTTVDAVSARIEELSRLPRTPEIRRELSELKAKLFRVGG